MNKTYLLLGGNVGDRINNIKTAARLLQNQTGAIIKHSSIYETDAWGNTEQPDFLNQVLYIETMLSASEYMHQILFIESEMGRIRLKKNDPRVIDIDILFFNDEVINEPPHLTIPHPEIPNRRFVLIPMNELSPDFVHPLLNKTIHYLLSVCKDMLQVRLVYKPYNL
jgi:2-amino-4-hydroxy-6-hydroxymethyldihydropteridine diphosphokinase